MRGESLGTRLPPTSAVSPLSPRRVYTRVMLMGIRQPPCRLAGILLEPHRGVGDDPCVKGHPRAVLGAASSIHLLHDRFTEILFHYTMTIGPRRWRRPWGGWSATWQACRWWPEPRTGSAGCRLG